MSLTASLEGAGQLGDTLHAAAEQLGSLTEVNRAEGGAALHAARIPRESGYLESTASVTATDDGFSLTAGAPYAGVVHAREPFFLRALEDRRDAIVHAHAEHVADALATVRGA